MADKEFIVPAEDIGVDGAYFGYTELIRCKECKHFRVYEIKDVTFSLCIRECMNAISMESDDYCSRAERKVKSSVYE